MEEDESFDEFYAKLKDILNLAILKVKQIHYRELKFTQ